MVTLDGVILPPCQRHREGGGSVTLRTSLTSLMRQVALKHGSDGHEGTRPGGVFWDVKLDLKSPGTLLLRSPEGLVHYLAYGSLKQIGGWGGVKVPSEKVRGARRCCRLRIGRRRRWWEASACVVRPPNAHTP
jgi:hypothetical protein